MYTYISLILSHSTGPKARIKARREVFQLVGISEVDADPTCYHAGSAAFATHRFSMVTNQLQRRQCLAPQADGNVWP